MVEVFMDLQTWRQIKTSGLSGCAMTKWLLYSCYSLQCTKSEPMSYLAVWKSLKQFRDFVRHRWILHFSQNMRLFLVHPSILHRFSVLSSCRGQCPTWSYLTSWTGLFSACFTFLDGCSGEYEGLSLFCTGGFDPSLQSVSNMHNVKSRRSRCCADAIQATHWRHKS